MSTFDKVRELIAKQLNKPIEEITEDKEFAKDLGADSLDLVDMLMNLEDDFGITIPEEDAVNIKTVGDIVSIIDKN